MLRYTRPAGQADDASDGSYTFTPGEAGLPDSTPAPTYGQGTQYNYDASGNPVPVGLTPQQETALFQGVGNILNSSGSSIASIVRGGDATARAALADQVRVRIAQLNTDMVAAQAANNAAAAASASSQIATLQQFSAQLNVQPAAAAIMTYVVIGLAGAAAVGLVFVASRIKPKTRKRVRHNPSRRRVCRNPSCGCGRARKGASR